MQDIYMTEAKRQFVSFEGKRRDSHLEGLKSKAEITSTRRLIETYNSNSLQHAVKHQIMSNRRQLRDNIEKQITKTASKDALNNSSS